MSSQVPSFIKKSLILKYFKYVAGILAMALLGSVGQTYDEIARALGFSQGEFIRTLF